MHREGNDLLILLNIKLIIVNTLLFLKDTATFGVFVYSVMTYTWCLQVASGT